MVEAYDVYVVVHSGRSTTELDFDLIVDWGQKNFYLDAYQIAQYRGASEREIIEHLAQEWLESAGERPSKICLIFK